MSDQPTPTQALAQMQAQLASINQRLAAGVRDIRDNNRSTTFDLAVLQQERARLEAQIVAAGGPLNAAPARPTLRRLFVTQHSKGL